MLLIINLYICTHMQTETLFSIDVQEVTLSLLLYGASNI